MGTNSDHLSYNCPTECRRGRTNTTAATLLGRKRGSNTSQLLPQLFQIPCDSEVSAVRFVHMLCAACEMRHKSSRCSPFLRSIIWDWQGFKEFRNWGAASRSTRLSILSSNPSPYDPFTTRQRREGNQTKLLHRHDAGVRYLS